MKKETLESNKLSDPIFWESERSGTLAQKPGSTLYELILGPEYHCGPVTVVSGVQSP